MLICIEKWADGDQIAAETLHADEAACAAWLDAGNDDGRTVAIVQFTPHSQAFFAGSAYEVTKDVAEKLARLAAARIDVHGTEEWVHPLAEGEFIDEVCADYERSAAEEAAHIRSECQRGHYGSAAAEGVA